MNLSVSKHDLIFSIAIPSGLVLMGLLAQWFGPLLWRSLREGMTGARLDNIDAKLKVVERARTETAWAQALTISSIIDGLQAMTVQLAIIGAIVVSLSTRSFLANYFIQNIFSLVLGLAFGRALTCFAWASICADGMFRPDWIEARLKKARERISPTKP